MIGVILQPSYIPWRGYFHQIQRADVFVFYDDVQYDKHGWRNRNRVKTVHGPQWLTIPVLSRGCVTQQTLIQDMAIDWHRDWASKHWNTLKQSYAKHAPYFQRYAPLLEEFYAQRPALLVDALIPLTIELARALGIQHTRFVRSSALDVRGDRVDRIIGILQTLGVRHYLSGPSARDYLDEAKFDAAGITLEYAVYDYPDYEQLHPPFEPRVSILDLLFMTGPDAPRYIWQRT